MPYTNAKSGSEPQQKFRFLTVAARFPVYDEAYTNARKPSRDREEAEQLYWQGQCFCPEPMDSLDKQRDVGVNARWCFRRCV